MYAQGMVLVVVSGDHALTAGQDFLQSFFHQLLVERVRVVKVELAPFRFRDFRRRQIAVEAVLRDANHLALRVVHLDLPQLLHDPLTDGALKFTHKFDVLQNFIDILKSQLPNNKIM